LVGFEDFGGLGGELAVGGDDAVGAEVIVVREVAVVAAVGEEFELAERSAEVSEFESERNLSRHAWAVGGSGDSRLASYDFNFPDLSVELAMSILCILGNSNVSCCIFNQTLKFSDR